MIEADVRKHNQWLSQNVTIEDIDKQIADLEELRKQKVEEEEAKNGSTPN